MKQFRSQLILACGLVLVLGAANVASGVEIIPLNNDCENAKTIGDVTDLRFDTTDATFDGSGLCMTSPNIWYCYTATCTGNVTVSLAGSSYDTMLAVYDGCECYPTQDDLIECNDDIGGSRQSKIIFDAIAGNQYLIEVGGYSSETGPGLLSISCEGVTPPPSSKDDCENAKAIGDVTDLQFDTTDATFDGSGLCMTSPNIWYCYTATCTGNVTVSLAGSSFDTMLAVYDGCECDPKSDDLIECNDDAVGFQSEIVFDAIAGNQYLIEVGGYNSETGQGLLSISCEGVTPPPSSKDDCENAKAIGDVTDLQFDTTDATFDGPGLCMTSPNIWYCYTATCTGNVTVSLAGSSFDTMLAVYDGCECDPTSDDLIECNDDAGAGYQSAVTFAAIAGNQYLIEVGGYGSDTGPGLLSINCEGVTPPPSSKDDCESAKAIGDVTDLQFDTTDATFDGSGLCMTSPNIWYCYTATCTGNVTVSLAGSSFDTMLAVYDGCECDPTSGDLIECNDDAGAGYQSAVTFAAIAGNQYLIEVGGYGSDTGPGLLSINCEGVTPPPSSKDDCESAKAIGDVTDLQFDTTDATFDGSGLCMTSPNIWYCYTATCTGNVTVSLAGSSFDTMLAVYDGCECYPTSDDLIECNDDAGSGYQSAVTFAAIAGNQYLIEVGGYGSEKGEGLISINCEGVAIQGKTDLGDASDSTNNLGIEMAAYPTSHTGLPYSIIANYPTVYDDGSGTGPYGPIHLNNNMVAYLGKTITREIEADTGPDEETINNIIPGHSANADGGDDAIKLHLNSLPNCCWTAIDYEVTVVDPNVDVWVNIWLDWNRDGDWDDVLDCPEGPAPEWAVQNQFLFNMPTGLNQITSPAFLPWHSDDRPENIWMRITLSEQPWKTGSNPGVLGNAGSGPQAKYEIGETEDYYFTPLGTACSICKDHDGDGDIDMDDLVFYTAEWLEKCP